MTTRLTDEQLTEVLALVKESDSVELKLTIPDSDINSTVQALGMDPIEAEIRQVVFFDTPDLSVNQAGVVVRARRIQGGAGDTVVKLRPVVPAELPDELRRSSSFGVEVDAMPGGFVCSGSLKGKSTADAVRQVVLGTKPLKGILSKEQRAFYKQHAPEDQDLGNLAVLGPINILKLKFEPEGFERRMVAEMWLYPNGKRLLELSTKCPPEETFQAAIETRGYLVSRGVNVEGVQETKTKTALEYFSGLLREAPADESGG